MRKTLPAIAALVLLLLAARPLTAFDAVIPDVADGLMVKSIRAVGTTAIDEKNVLSVMPLKSGDVYTRDKIEQSVDYLKRWGVFDRVALDVQAVPGGIDLIFNLTDAIIVAQIDIAGNYPFIENKVRKYLSLRVGNAYSAEVIDEQIRRLADFYEREGYVDSDFSVSEEPGPEQNQLLLTFRIHKGYLIRYRTIEIEGNRAYPDGRFVSAINTYKPYSERRLRRALRSLKDFYNENGYPRVKIRIKRKTIDLAARRADITIEVNEGPYVGLRFDGNTRLTAAELRKIVTIYREGSFDGYEIEQSIKELSNHYLRQGFPDVRIDAERTKIHDDHYVIVFRIDEGIRRYVKRISFDGLDHASASKLRNNMITQQHAFGQPGALLDGNIDADMRTIENNFKSQGFLNAHIEPWEIALSEQGFAYEITIPVDEGAQTMVGEVNFVGNHYATSATLADKLTLKAGKPYNPTALDDEQRIIKMYYADHGYPYAEVLLEPRIDDRTQTAQLNVLIDEGPEVRIGEIIVVGDVLTSQKAIKGAVALKQGDVFSYQKLLDSQLNLRRLGAFSSVRIETIGIEERETTVHLKVSVDEERPFKLDVDLGYSTRDSFIGSLVFTNINSFGWGKKTFLKLTGGEKLSRVQLGWRDPRFLSSNYEMTVITWLQHRIQPTFNFVQIGGVFGFYRRFDRLGLSFLQEFNRNYFVEGDSVAADAQSLRNNTLSNTSISASYDARDNFADPTKGYYALGKIYFFNEIGGNDAHFARFTVQTEYNIGFWRRFVVSLAGRFDNIETIGRNVSIPTQELLYMGGADTVRGYAEDSLGPANAQGKATGGRIRWILNNELRLRMFRGFQLAGFADIGSLTGTFSEIGTASIRSSAGVGLRYITPVGPLRLDVGFPLDRNAGEDAYRIHFTFGYVF